MNGFSPTNTTLSKKNASTNFSSCIAETEPPKIELFCFAEWMVFAHQGYIDAQRKVGVDYLNGNGVKQNIWVALYWLIKVANKGCADTQYQVGELFCSKGQLFNASKGLKYLGMAAEQGHEQARNLLYGLGQVTLMVKELSANAGNVDDMLSVAKIYRDGANGIPIDAKKAYAYYLKAATQGASPKAAFVLSSMYARGEGTTKDWKKGHFWLQVAIDRGDPQALEFVEFQKTYTKSSA